MKKTILFLLLCGSVHASDYPIIGVITANPASKKVEINKVYKGELLFHSCYAPYPAPSGHYWLMIGKSKEWKLTKDVGSLQSAIDSMQRVGFHRTEIAIWRME